MFGLAVMVAFGLYLLLSYIVVRMAAGYARRHGRSTARWGWGAAVVMYLLVFWDWIPTIVAHRYYCATEAGIWVYKTFYQWQKENPEIEETLTTNKVLEPVHEGDNDNWTNIYTLNQRISQKGKHSGPLFLHVWEYKSELIDVKTNETLLRLVDFSTSQERRGGGWHGWKFWLSVSHCDGYIKRAIQFGETERHFIGNDR